MVRRLSLVVALLCLMSCAQGPSSYEDKFTNLNPAWTVTAEEAVEWAMVKDSNLPTLTGSPEWLNYLGFLEEKLAEYKSRVSDPKATFEADGRGVPEGHLDTGFIHWLTLVNTFGDDGKRYCMEFVAMTGIKEAGVDISMLEVSTEIGSIVQMPGYIYKIAKYPFIQAKRNMFPSGTLTMKKSEKEVIVDLPDTHIVCKDDNTWHYDFLDKERISF